MIIYITKIHDYTSPHSDIYKSDNVGGKTIICDRRAFRHDGHETLPGDGGGKEWWKII